jgi:hypothetical protein
VVVAAAMVVMVAAAAAAAASVHCYMQYVPCIVQAAVVHQASGLGRWMTGCVLLPPGW